MAKTKKRRKITDRLDVTCDYCNRLMKPGGVVTRVVKDKEYQFCSKKCRDEFVIKKVWKEEKSVFERYVETTKDTKKHDILIVGIALLIILVLGVAVGTYVMTLPSSPVYAKLEMIDVTPLEPKPTGDGKTAKLPMRIEMKNEGLGESGHIDVRLSAINLTNSFEVDSFTTSRLERLDNHEIVDKVPPGVSVVIYGNLTLPPGSYKIKVSIYENGNRELVSGDLIVKVDISTVKTERPYEGKSQPGEEKPGKGAPGMEAIVVISVMVIALFIKMRKIKNI